MKRTLFVLGIVAVWEIAQYGTRWASSWVMEDFNREYRELAAERKAGHGEVPQPEEEEDWWV